MSCRQLEQIDFEKCDGIPLSALKSENRVAHPRLKALSLHNIPISVDDFVHFLTYVADNVDCEAVMWKSRKEVRKIVKCLLFHGRQCELFLCPAKPHSKVFSHLKFPNQAVNFRKNEEEMVMNVFAGWKINVSLFFDSVNIEMFPRNKNRRRRTR
ncbi:hypothetical protein QR680_010400 [Steinernema hermaphroditum]|uniref:F-box domain-containing protein n=1 Tax=Steinernema hermaphroditum TaxID=289476 RepID=A0AA39IRH5_9BILA|nr:hypothetical protein QR680_010400 [Steinernema hermaphroditum]